MRQPSRIAALSISDRASRGIYEDQGVPAIAAFLEQVMTSKYDLVENVIPDDYDTIVETLRSLAKEQGCDLILTTGGTGPAPRDVTPEATLAVGDKALPGFGELMRSVSLEIVPTAILSRQTAVVCHESLIINLPGKPSAIKDCLEAVFPAVPYCLDLIGAAYIETDPEVLACFRPKGSK